MTREITRSAQGEKTPTPAAASAAMSPVTFPFAALVGLDTLKLALQLAALDRRLSVLVRGDKGAGKSTAARGLVDLLDAGAPFVTLPIGATEDRLLGGLDLEKTIAGQPTLKRGLLAEADGGVLYVDEVNLLPDHLADALLDAVASGMLVVEREGFSATQRADFVMLGSMNPEEGALRPQLLDRFALAVDVEAPMDPAVRGAVLERRLAFDAAAARFREAWREEQAALAARMASARRRLPAIAVSREMLHDVASRVAAHDVRSLRADLAVVRAARAYAALTLADGEVPGVTASHIEAVLPLALAHRAIGRGPSPRMAPPMGPSAASPPPAGPSAAEPRESAQPPQSKVPPEGRASSRANDDSSATAAGESEPPGGEADTSCCDLDDDVSDEASEANDSAGETPDGRASEGGDPDAGGTGRGTEPGAAGQRERMFAAIGLQAPRLIVERATDRVGAGRARGTTEALSSLTGPIVATRPSATPRELDARASIAHAAARTGTTRIAAVDLHERVRRPRRATRYIFIVDSSGSHAAQDRMRLVKGAVNGLLDESHGRHDEVVLIACRGAAATVLLAPTSSRDAAVRQLEYLPTGGRTPLAHALELAATFVTDHAVAVLVTDGHANVPSRSDDAWADAQAAARQLGCPALVIDTEDARQATGRPRQLADAMRGTHVRLAELTQETVIRLIAEVS